MFDETGLYADVIFCDDIRQEIQNKVSLVGVYSNSMHVLKNHEILPKLCVMARLKFKKSAKHTIKVSVLYGEEEYSSDEVTLDETDKSVTDTHAFIFSMSPFKLRGEGEVKVVAHIDGGEARELSSMNVSYVDSFA